MYNRYLATAQQQPQQPQQPPHQNNAQPVSSLLSGLGQRLSGFRLDADTLIALAVVWFALREDGEEIDTDLLIAIGVLLLLGL